MKFYLLIILSMLLYACGNNMKKEVQQRKYQVGIQPIGDVNPKQVKLIQDALKKEYGFETTVLPVMDPPKRAFINIKSPRYRADTLIRILRDKRPDSIGIIFGLTAKDISITKYGAEGEIKKPEYKYKDFGIFGLGFKPGPSSVVSVYRLGKGKTLRSRLKKIALHEIGHNLGLKHCPDKSCLMTDAVESIRTVDAAKETLCNNCKGQIQQK
jgi:archaemetzincin